MSGVLASCSSFPLCVLFSHLYTNTLPSTPTLSLLTQCCMRFDRRWICSVIALSHGCSAELCPTKMCVLHFNKLFKVEVAALRIVECEMNQHRYCLILMIKHPPPEQISMGYFLMQPFIFLYCFMIVDSVTHASSIPHLWVHFSARILNVVVYCTWTHWVAGAMSKHLHPVPLSFLSYMACCGIWHLWIMTIGY